jgi:hypothetical protein
MIDPKNMENDVFRRKEHPVCQPGIPYGRRMGIAYSLPWETPWSSRMESQPAYIAGI